MVPNITKYWGGVFWHWADYLPGNGWEAFPVVQCTDLFAGQSTHLLDMFNNDYHADSYTGWLCPNVTMLNYTGSFSSWDGSSQYMFRVDYCSVVADALGYIDPNCETNLTLNDQIMQDAGAGISTMAVS
jgi:hypothetical protein